MRTVSSRIFLLALAGCLASGCGGFDRRLSYAAERSAAMRGVQMNYAVYLPPGFSAEERLPLIVFLHGGGDSHDAFDRHGISAQLDESMASGDVPRAVILLPSGDLGFWMNWYDETRRYEDWIADELVPTVAANYDTLPCPEHCHVMGVSMGGAGAMRMAHHRPDRFSTVTSISGPVMDTEQMISFAEDRLLAILMPTHRIFGPTRPRERIEEDDLFLRWTSPESTRLDSIVIAWVMNDREGIVGGSRALHDHFEDHHIPHAAWEYEGDHAWVSWAPIIERAIAYQLRDRIEESVE
jgi:enterochelin esterase-like enzyme